MPYWGGNGEVSRPSEIVIVRALPGLGDMLCVVPALRALRAAHPQAHVTVVGLSQTASLVGRFSDLIDELIPFPGFPGIVECDPNPRALPEFLTAIHARDVDWALQMHGDGRITNLFTALLDASLSAGFYVSGRYCPDPTRYLPYDDRESEVRRYLRLMTSLNIPPQGEELTFPLRKPDYDELRQVEEARSLGNAPYVCLHPGACDPARRWSLTGFAGVGDFLAREGFQVVLTGTQGEDTLVRAVVDLMETDQSLNLVGRTTLGALATLLEGSRLLVCNDTGVSHLAAALNVPSVVIFTSPSSNPDRWAPLPQARHRVVRLQHVPATRGRVASRYEATRAVIAEALDVLKRDEPELCSS